MKKKIVLFRPRVRLIKYLYSKHKGAFLIEEDYPRELGTITGALGIPISLLYVAAPLVADGYEVKIIDEDLDPDYETHLEEDLKEVLAVGITVLFAGSQVQNALRFAALVRRYTSAPLIWGGYHISALPEESMRNTLVDVAVEGDGEATMLELAHTLEAGGSLEGVQGCWYKSQGKIYANPPRALVNLDNVPPLPYHLLDIEKYIYINPVAPGLRFFAFFTSRGCTHNCRYCFTHILCRQSWRFHSIETVIATMKYFKHNHNVQVFGFRDDNFFNNAARVKAFCQALIAENLDIRWGTTSRIDYWINYDEAFIKLLKASGLIFLEVGIESASNKLLKMLGKGYRQEDISRGLQKVEQAGGINIFCSFIKGFPTETKADIYETVRFIAQFYNYKCISKFLYGIYMLFPGSELFQELKSQGLEVPDSLEAWGSVSNIRLLFPKERSFFYINLVKMILRMNHLRLNRSKLINKWLKFRLWLVYALKWEWTLPLALDLTLIEKIELRKRSLKIKFLDLYRTRREEA